MPKTSRPPADDESALFLPSATVLVAYEDRSGCPQVLAAVDHAYYGRYPPIMGFSVPRRARPAYRDLLATRGFTLNVPDARYREHVRRCQHEVGQPQPLAVAGLTAAAAQEVRAPLVQECIVNLECAFRHALALGEYDFILGEVVMAHMDTEYNIERGNIQWTRYARVQ